MFEKVHVFINNFIVSERSRDVNIHSWLLLFPNKKIKM